MQNAIVTIESPRGGHRTFRISRRKPDARWAPGCQVLSILSGPENEYDYEAFAFILADQTIRVFGRHRSAPPDRPTDWEIYADMIEHRPHYESRGYRYLESRLCAVCNRRLTTPESIRDGVGPFCAGRI